MTKVEETKEENHVLMVAFASQGHINPMLRLGKRLLKKGLHVTFATTEVARHRMLKSVAATADTDSISGITFVFFSDGFSLDYNRMANLDHYMDCLPKNGATNLTNLIKERYPIGGNKKLLCLINNPFVPWVANVATELQLPCAMVWIQPGTLFTIYYHYYNKLSQFPTPTNPEMSVDLPGLPFLLTEDLPSFVLPSNQFGAISKLIQETFETIKNYNWVLANSFFELEKDAFESMQGLISSLRPVGPLVPSSLLGEKDDDSNGFEMWKADDSCINWLDKQESSSVVYVSFGSISVLPAKQMEAIALALKAIRCPFLWVVKLPDVPPQDGSGQLPLEFLEDTKGLGLVVSWSPQTKVLAHQAVGCFITHCGWNSLSETISAGVPVIGYPQWTDQPTNAKLIVDVFRTGLRLRPGEDGIVTSEEIELCVREIMYGLRSEELKSNASELKRLAREAVAGGGSSDRNIQWFVDEIMKKGCNVGCDPNGVCDSEVEKELSNEGLTHPLI